MVTPEGKEAIRARVAFIALTAACYVGLAFWPDFMAALGAGHAGVWFLDINTLLASNDAVVLGLDPYQPNPLDYLRDAHEYSEWWLQLHRFGWGRDDRVWLGIVVTLFFFSAVFWTLRPRSGREMLVAWLIVWSPPLMLGFNRANPDLLIYALLALVPSALSRGRPVARGLAWVAIILAIGMKYFPALACLLVAWTARSRREFLLMILGWAVIGAALAFNLWDDVGRTGHVTAAARGFYTFGASVLAANVGHGAWIFAIGFTLAFVAFARGWARPCFENRAESHAEIGAFFLGAVLLIACFSLTISYTYRFVFALMLLPWLLELTRASDQRQRRYAWTLLLGTLGLFWSDGLAVVGINALTGSISPASRAALIDVLVVFVHGLGWCWVLLLLAGLGTVTKLIFARWGLFLTRASA